RGVRDSLAAWQNFCGGANNVRTIDLGSITPIGANDDQSPAEAGQSSKPASRYFCCVAGVGIDGEVSRRANRLPRWLRGNGGYMLSVAPTLFTFDAVPIRVLTKQDSATNDGWKVRCDQPTLIAAFANTPLYGGG